VTRRIGYAAGAFDLFHVGHLNILRQAKSRCDHLIAGVVSDEMLRLVKGVDPVVPLAERLEIVSHISFVDEAVAEVVPDKLDTWRRIGFDVFFKGDDWRGTPKGGRSRGRVLPLHPPHVEHCTPPGSRQPRSLPSTGAGRPRGVTGAGRPRSTSCRSRASPAHPGRLFVEVSHLA
jgi:glycerol-3-phosphate cytidylyltransferase